MQEKIQFPDGTNIYITDGQLHRTDGPALETSDGTCYYFYDGQLHRENGPAICSADPNLCHWYIHGVRVPSKSRTQLLVGELRQKFLGINPAGDKGSQGSSGSVTNPPRKPKK